MEKGYYWNTDEFNAVYGKTVAIHNKNGQGLLLLSYRFRSNTQSVAIHNKNGQGLLPDLTLTANMTTDGSQSTIKMDKGYYRKPCRLESLNCKTVAIHNKNGQGLLRRGYSILENTPTCRNPQ